MCGLLISLRPTGTLSYAELAVALDYLHHRGPDGTGIQAWRRDASGLLKRARNGSACHLFMGHKRLSIIDLSDAGSQPMGSADEQFSIVLNGEIYNYKELRLRLSKIGYKFTSNTDTEVLLRAWQEWGKNCLQYLVGMYAFCIADFKRNILYAVRDPYGIKPFFMMRESNTLTLSSEIAPLLRVKKTSPKISAQLAFDFIRWGLTEHQESTLIRGIDRLKPGHITEFDLLDGSITRVEKFVKPNLTHQGNQSYTDAVDQFRHIFLESVRLHLRTDVPLGFTLSGGLDSSSIVCAARHLEPDLRIDTFSYIPAKRGLSEETWIDIVNKQVNAHPHKLDFSPSSPSIPLPQLASNQGEPFASTSIWAQAEIFNAAHASGMKVMIDGQGGDEALGGYIQHCSAYMADLVSHLRLSQAASLADRLCGKDAIPLSLLLQLTAQDMLPASLITIVRKIIRRDVVPIWIKQSALNDFHIAPGLPYREVKAKNYFRNRFCDMIERANLPDLLRYQDRNAMAVSIEARVPFLSPPVLGFTGNLPPAFLLNEDRGTKAILKDAMAGIVPDEILSRRDKKGFQAPEEDWIFAFIKILEAYSPGNAIFDLVDREHFLKILSSTGFTHNYHSSIWRVISLASWIDWVTDMSGQIAELTR
ncbi:MAG TPA: asparagine synthase (glutamine-hydrolyzing) [Alteromonas australica]|uniref:asparagine synthase (glutamine-hydrolyzing) n=1 Tax=Alteromonas australica TaxID=589873 RepID=A0A350P8F1_9ALTE|nr:asparagine synthase (glutamine-hydrolyzing) [Parvibaculaceae bacterium]HAW77568.1 asparagine synthase (glutamine-hydrolyzing) [Alteromonas australica]